MKDENNSDTTFCQDLHECGCGGGVATFPPLHTIGSFGYYRYMTTPPKECGTHETLDCPTWEVGGIAGITDFTLRQQRGYHQHKCGCWSTYETVSTV